jgi:hypothetical protein
MPMGNDNSADPADKWNVRDVLTSADGCASSTQYNLNQLDYNPVGTAMTKTTRRRSGRGCGGVG